MALENSGLTVAGGKHGTVALENSGLTVAGGKHGTVALENSGLTVEGGKHGTVAVENTGPWERTAGTDDQRTPALSQQGRQIELRSVTGGQRTPDSRRVHGDGPTTATGSQTPASAVYPALAQSVPVSAAASGLRLTQCQ